jgi:hypothetical protein
MSQQPQGPSEQERKAFIEKLGQFRSSLPQPEQRMLDAMAIAAFGGQQEQGDVQGYGWFYGPYGPVYTGPTFYQTGWQTQWYATPWGAAYNTVPAGVWYP